MNSTSNLPEALALTFLVIIVIVVAAVVCVLIVSFAQHEADEVRAHRADLAAASEERSATRSWAAWLSGPCKTSLAENEEWARARLHDAASARRHDESVE
ncbi:MULTISPECIES: hypothetical protein [unclassified Aeromicrobium]|uniref:hypothetical protein n=1 Tax=unclassified Aeromicrobium TaxID=2633570 RepID=UPI00288AF89A|nr:MULTISPECIES: hypothetical protein [unclassified Aeromicrobium]